MLLAAGLGKRLQPLTLERPKPIVPVLNRPLGAFALEHLAGAGLTHIVANTHVQPQLVERELAAHQPVGVELRFSRERTLLGTGGGVWQARRFFQADVELVVVMNADLLFAPDVQAAIDVHRRHGAIATMVIRPSPDAALARVFVDAEGRVQQLLGRPVVGLDAYMFTGVHVLSARALSQLPHSGCIIERAYQRWLAQGDTVMAVVDRGPWEDLGSVEAYHRANLALLRGDHPWPGVRPQPALIADDAQVANAVIEESVVGAGVHVAQNVTLRRCVVWPGARVSESATDAVLTRDHRVASC